jgi:hypothetical protein
MEGKLMFIIPCELCGKRISEHRHHKLSQSKMYRKLYGVLLDRPENIMYLCSVDHLNKAIPKWNEIQFCIALGITPRSKIGQLEYARLTQKQIQDIKKTL